VKETLSRLIQLEKEVWEQSDSLTGTTHYNVYQRLTTYTIKCSVNTNKDVLVHIMGTYYMYKQLSYRPSESNCTCLTVGFSVSALRFTGVWWNCAWSSVSYL